MRREEIDLPQPPANDRPSDRWMCARHGKDACSQGPDGAGQCPLAEACRPTPTWTYHRKRVVTGVVALAAVALLASLFPSAAPTVYKPGELSSPHAQILSGTITSNRCASCHPAAATTPADFFEAGSEGHRGVSLSDRCMDCHHATIAPETSAFAHNLPATALAQMRFASLGGRDRLSTSDNENWRNLLPATAIDQTNVACSACHKEHQGLGGNLLAVSDAQCQSCHSERFGSFADSHPDWHGWPYGRGGAISFDHASHAGKHFPASKEARFSKGFECAQCHTRTVDGELTRGVSFERGCASCHAESIQTVGADGIELLALPSLPDEVAERFEHDNGRYRWPESATGLVDGSIAPLTELLLRSNRDVAAAIRTIPNRDFSRLDPNDQRSATASQTVADAHFELVQDIANSGGQAIERRTKRAGVSPNLAKEILRTLPPQLLQDASKHWFNRKEADTDPNDSVINDLGSEREPLSERLFGDQGDELLGDDDLLGLDDSLDEDDLIGSDDLLEQDDDLLSDPLGSSSLLSTEAPTSKRPERFDSERMLPSGGWYRDDIRLAIRYRAAGHADPVMRSIVEMIAELSPSDPVRKRLLSQASVKACVECHQAAIDAPPSLVTRHLGLASWKSWPLVGGKQEFTKFSHGPHLNIAQLADCSHCHQVTPAAIDSHGVGLVDSGEFKAMTRQSCAACHTPKAAGDRCVDCHRYHIDHRPTNPSIRDEVPSVASSESIHSF